jgi:predicted MFS family arabinose efflux permease
MIGSLGFHTWMPINNALGLALASKENAGQILGRIQAIGFAASLLSMGLIILFVQTVGYRVSFFVSGAAMVLGAVAILAYPRNLAEKPKERLVFRRRYWLYYLLTFLDGCRGEVFLAFGVYLLVQQYRIGVETITALLLVSSVASMLLSAPIGRLIDRVGERRTLTFSYSCHLIAFLGFALVRDATVAIVSSSTRSTTSSSCSAWRRTPT